MYISCFGIPVCHLKRREIKPVCKVGFCCVCFLLCAQSTSTLCYCSLQNMLVLHSALCRLYTWRFLITSPHALPKVPAPVSFPARPGRCGRTNQTRLRLPQHRILVARSSSWAKHANPLRSPEKVALRSKRQDFIRPSNFHGPSQGIGSLSVRL